MSLSKGAASTADLEKLAAACQPATFGVNQADVLDESYRKAGTMNTGNFMLGLDVDKTQDWSLGRTRRRTSELSSTS